MFIRKTKHNKGTVPYEAKGFRSGFVILFAVTLSAIILSIALGVTNIALKEIKFGTSAKDTNNAFFAADTGAECALVNDKSTGSAFVSSPPSITCNNSSIPVTENPTSVWNFTVSGLGSGGQGCAKVTVDKTTSLISIISKGYNVGGASCDSTSTGRVERELKVTYFGSSSAFSCSNLPANGTACSGTSGLTQDREYSLVSSCSADQTDKCEATCGSGYILSGGACVANSPSFSATGGTITYTDSSGLNPRASPAYAGGYTVHTFTTSGTFTVTGSGNVSVLVVGGGGHGGTGDFGGGGGAGGLIYKSSHSVTSGGITVTIGGGSQDSVFGTLTAKAGGNGGNGNVGGSDMIGRNGGSGGGSSFGGVGGSATQPLQSGDSGTYGFGNRYGLAGGGGGAGGTGIDDNGSSGSSGGDGGVGKAYSISGVSTYYAGGGGGGNDGGPGSGGLGGGGGGSWDYPVGGSGAVNTGGGGGGGGYNAGGPGGSGIVITRYLTP